MKVARPFWMAGQSTNHPKNASNSVATVKGSFSAIRAAVGTEPGVKVHSHHRSNPNFRRTF